MATIINFPGTNNNEPESKQTNKARTEEHANRVAHILVYTGLCVSALTLCVGSVYHKTKKLYKKVRNKTK